MRGGLGTTKDLKLTKGRQIYTELIGAGYSSSIYPAVLHREGLEPIPTHKMIHNEKVASPSPGTHRSLGCFVSYQDQFHFTGLWEDKTAPWEGGG